MKAIPFNPIQFACVALVFLFVTGCDSNNSDMPPPKTVPHEGRWGIYRLNLATNDVHLIYSSNVEIFASVVELNSQYNILLFAQKIDGVADENYEICTIQVDGSNFSRLTNNAYWDVYPVWSPNGDQIIFLSMRQTDFDIYRMNADGSDQQLLYDSGTHDGDLDWAGNQIVFTSGSRLWKMNSNGTDADTLTHPPNAGQWGNANLPFGDYDPRFSPDGTKIVFERLENDLSVHGNYNLFTINLDGTSETRLTNNGYSQGFGSWSYSGTKIVYSIAAFNDQGVYDLCVMNSDGSDNHNITPDYFPANFLCHAASFSPDDLGIYFIGEWYE